eukprot:Colp12_sorted_trinity150504_noHs@18230
MAAITGALRNASFVQARRLPALTRNISLDAHKYKTLSVTEAAPAVLRVELNRPDKSNAMTRDFWREIRECFERIGEDSDCRAVVLTAAGKNYTAGLDLQDAAEDFFSLDGDDFARKAYNLRKTIIAYQASFTAIEKCLKPVIAAVHGACVGGGVDMVTACDIRYCTQDAWFSIKEVDVGLAADVGTLQRLPKVVGNDSLVRELAYTGRKLGAQEAKECGLVSKIVASRDEVIQAALETATLIAEKSPVAIAGTKYHLVNSRDKSVTEGLDNMVSWNMAMLQTDDMMQAFQAAMTKTKPQFAKL